MAQSSPFFYDNGVLNGAITLDLNNGEEQKLELDGAATIDFSNPFRHGSIYVLELVSSGNAVTWDVNIDWGDAGAPTLSLGGKKDLFNFYFDGVKYLGSYATGYLV